MTPKQAALELTRIGKRIEKAAIRGLNAAAREGRMIARQDSSGRYNTRRRQKKGYSYSRIAPNPPADPAIINVQTGRFRSAWQTQPATGQWGGNLVALVYNNSDRAQYLTEQGTKTMIGRPIERRIRARLEPVFLFEVERAIVRVI